MLKNNQIDILIESWTGGRSKEATGFKAERVEALKEALEAEIEKYNELNENGALKSVTNDGYSETYQVERREDFEKRLKSLAYTYLSGTGLMGAFYV